MEQQERITWLIGELQKEMPEYAGIALPGDPEGRWQLFRGLCNLRPPRKATAGFLKMQDAFLREMTREKGIVPVDSLQPSQLDSRLFLWQGDITRLQADAIVNAANSQLLGCFRPNHNCIDNLIQTMAGVQLRYACWQLMEEQGHPEPAGGAKITQGYNLPARNVLHTVGPIVQGKVTERDRQLLASCYRSCLELASSAGLHSLAFCCISTGVFGYPQAEAARTAVKTVREWLAEHPRTSLDKIVFDVYKDQDQALYKALLEKVSFAIPGPGLL